MRLPLLIAPRSIAGLTLVSTLLLTACDRGAPVDLNGNRVDPLASRAPATVLLFVSTRCPISNRYTPELRRLYDLYHPRGADFFLVYADAHDSTTDIQQHLKDYQLTIPALRDPAHRLVKWARATTTPEAALFSQGALVYHGRIDDRWLDLGRERPSATTHDLADAIEAALANRPPPRQKTPPVGCAIE